MPSWIRTIGGSVDATGLARALYHAYTGQPLEPLPEAYDAGTFTTRLGPLEVTEVLEWRPTPGDDVLSSMRRTFRLEGRFRVDWCPVGTTVEVEDAARAVPVIEQALGLCVDELDAVTTAGRSAALVIDVFGQAATRLAQIRYSPMRLGYVVSGDVTEEVARLDALSPRLPDAAPLVAALCLAGAGRYDEALARLEPTGAARVDRALLRLDVLSRTGRHEAALAALAALPPLQGDALAHSALALAVAVFLRAGRPREAAAAALALAAEPTRRDTVLGVLDVEARLVAARCLEEAGDPTTRELTGVLLPRDLVAAERLARRRERPAQWFAVEHLDTAWLRGLTRAPAPG